MYKTTRRKKAKPIAGDSSPCTCKILALPMTVDMEVKTSENYGVGYLWGQGKHFPDWLRQAKKVRIHAI